MTIATGQSERLTCQEIRVMNLAAVGMQSKTIAGKLGTSISCVKRRLRAIARKLNLRGIHYRVVLAHYALHEGLPNLFDQSKTKVKL